MFSDWGTDNCSSAQQILSSITNFEFIVVFLLVYQYLSNLSGITVQLQGTTVDIIEAYTLISATKEVYQKEREKVEEGFTTIDEHSVRVESHVGVDSSMPRIATWQQHRSNAPAECPFEYYKKNVTIPFLDHILFNLDSQFSPIQFNHCMPHLCLLWCLPSFVQEMLNSTMQYKYIMMTCHHLSLCHRK